MWRALGHKLIICDERTAASSLETQAASTYVDVNYTKYIYYFSLSFFFFGSFFLFFCHLSLPLRLRSVHFFNIFFFRSLLFRCSFLFSSNFISDLIHRYMHYHMYWWCMAMRWYFHLVVFINSLYQNRKPNDRMNEYAIVEWAKIWRKRWNHKFTVTDL